MCFTITFFVLSIVFYAFLGKVTLIKNEPTPATIQPEGKDVVEGKAKASSGGKKRGRVQ